MDFYLRRPKGEKSGRLFKVGHVQTIRKLNYKKSSEAECDNYNFEPKSGKVRQRHWPVMASTKMLWRLSGRVRQPRAAALWRMILKK